MGKCGKSGVALILKPPKFMRGNFLGTINNLGKNFSLLVLDLQLKNVFVPTEGFYSGLITIFPRLSITVPKSADKFCIRKITHFLSSFSARFT